jgi:hyperosmotically inducible protein
MKISRTVFPVLVGIALATGLVACDRSGSKPTTGGSVMSESQDGMSGKVDKAENVAGDTAITAKVKVALLKASDLKSTGISVDTKDGQVTLTGTVPAAPQVDQAAKVTEGVEGVRTVDNKLTVKSAS